MKFIAIISASVFMATTAFASDVGTQAQPQAGSIQMPSGSLGGSVAGSLGVIAVTQVVGLAMLLLMMNADK